VRKNCRVHGALATLVWVVCIAALVIGLLALLSNRRTWEDFGKDGLLMESDAAQNPGVGSAAALRERDEEIRQMLEARNARRVRRGEAPIEVEQELSRLTRPQVDPELRQEIRDLVKARNYRRARAGKPPLDVDAEVEREISRLGEL
jgi:hypothetical protein